MIDLKVCGVYYTIPALLYKVGKEACEESSASPKPGLPSNPRYDGAKILRYTKDKRKSREYLHKWVPRSALRPVTQMVASSAEEAMRSNEEKSSPWIMENVQSNEEVLDPTPTEVEDVDEVVEAATATAAATPAPDVGTEEAP